MSYQILLAEDDSQIREVIEDYFTEKSNGDFHLQIAQTGEEALDAVCEKEFDLCLLDIMLPGASGFEICRAIRQNSIVPINKHLLTADKIYIMLISGEPKEQIDILLTKEQKKMMKLLSSMPSILRTEYAYALLAEKNDKKAAKIKKQLNNMAKSYPYAGEIASEQELIDIADKAADKSLE